MTVTYYTLGCFSVIVLRFEEVPESVVNKWEEIFYFRLQIKGNLILLFSTTSKFN